MNNREIYTTPTFHHDIAYLQPEATYTKMADDILVKALSIMRENKDYCFTVEQAYYFKHFWEANPQLHEEMIGFAKEGRLSFAPGFWSVPDMCMPSGESIYMQATLGQNLLKNTVGIRPRSALIADCWGHHGQLPQILTQCGYDYYTFSRCMERNFARENFIWQGIDGTRIKGHWMSTGYAGINFPSDAAAVNAEELHWEDASKDGIMNLYNRNRQHCGDSVQLMPAGGDMKMPSSSAPCVVEKLNEDDQIPKIKFASFDKAFDNIDFSNAPLYTDEFISSLKGTFTTNIQIKQLNRQLESKLYALEVLSVLNRTPVDLTSPWETLLKNQFHDILCGTICDDALSQVEEEYAQAFKQLPESTQNNNYFNPLPFDTQKVIFEKQQCKVLTANGFGFAEERLLTGKEIKLPLTFENDFYRAEIGDKGYITKLTEKHSGEDIFNHQRLNFGNLLLQVDHGDNWCYFAYPWEQDATSYTTNIPDPYSRREMPEHNKIDLANGGVNSVSAEIFGEGEVVRITQKGNLRHWIVNMPILTTTTFYKNSPRIDYHTEIECNDRFTRLRVAFPTDIKDGKVVYQIPFGTVERNSNNQVAEMFMNYSGEKASLALINRGIPSNETEDGIMMLNLFRSVAMEYKCQSQLSYNLGRAFAFDYAIMPHGNDLESLWERALEFNREMIPAEKCEIVPFGVENAQLSALRYCDGGVFMRIYNPFNRPVTARVDTASEYTSFCYADGCMNPVSEKIPLKSILTEELAPFKVQNIILYK